MMTNLKLTEDRAFSSLGQIRRPSPQRHNYLPGSQTHRVLHSLAACIHAWWGMQLRLIPRKPKLATQAAIAEVFARYMDPIATGFPRPARRETY
jgi:hypothetical protein